MNGIIELMWSIVLVLFLLYVFPKVKKETGVKGVLTLYLAILISIGLYLVTTSLFWGTEQIKVFHILICVVFVFTILFFVFILQKSPEIHSAELRNYQTKETINNNEITIFKSDSIKDKNSEHFIFPPTILKAFYSEFYKANLINQELNFEEFKVALNEKRLCIDLNSPSLYYFHSQIKLIDKKIKLNNFIKYFKDINGNEFNYGTVRNGKTQTKPLHKELIDTVFDINTMTN